jgi:hypothetical protein
VVIHVYSLCWNEERILPYFFKYYDKIADKYYFLDNNSTDNSYSILKSHPNTIVNKIDLQGSSVVEAAKQQYNHMWEQSRGIADWVIICDVDEYLYHLDLRNYLEKCTSTGITLVVPTGYEMISEVFPSSDKPLYETVKYGVRSKYMDKPQMFNPTEIQEINFWPGRHGAEPIGNVRKSSDMEVLLLHYKYLGFDYVNTRHLELKNGLRESDLAHGYGRQYLWDEKERLETFLKLKNESIKVL